MTENDVMGNVSIIIENEKLMKCKYIFNSINKNLIQMSEIKKDVMKKLIIESDIEDKYKTMLSYILE